VLAGVLQPGSLESRGLRLIELHTCLAHPAIVIVLLDVIAFIPNSGAGNASTLRPRPAWELAENAVFNGFWWQIGHVLGGVGDNRKGISNECETPLRKRK
jgi:hypothetical protein